MEFPFYISSVLNPDENGYSVVTSQQAMTTLGMTQRGKYSLEAMMNPLTEIIDTMGMYSQKAQKLPIPITTLKKFTVEDQRIYFISKEKSVVGFIKVGVKNLFYREMSGKMREMQPLCVLDFYIHFNCQRQGYGKKLFESMLQGEKVTPNQLAYDRPSRLLIFFLQRHYKLKAFVPQNNNFVIFNQYFNSKFQYTPMNYSPKKPKQQKENLAQKVQFEEQKQQYKQVQQKQIKPYSIVQKDFPSYTEIRDLAQKLPNMKQINDQKKGLYSPNKTRTDLYQGAGIQYKDQKMMRYFQDNDRQVEDSMSRTQRELDLVNEKIRVLQIEEQQRQQQKYIINDEKIRDGTWAKGDNILYKTTNKSHFQNHFQRK